jgi:hypothetical protein
MEPVDIGAAPDTVGIPPAVAPPEWSVAAASPQLAADARFFPETGHAVAGPFRGFLEAYGVTVCGYPISDARVEDGVRTQYFEHLALEEDEPGHVRLKRLGEAWLARSAASAAEAVESQSAPMADVERPILDLTAELPRHPTRSYPMRSLGDIRYLVLHHTGAPADVTPEMIAREHVQANGWPGIGYHYVVSAAGDIFRTQDITVVTHHARQFNPVSVGLALSGDFTSSVPTPDQLDATAEVLARLRLDLGLPPTSLRGHREMVPTPCPGDTFMSLWKPRLDRLVEQRLIRIAAPFR